MAITFVRIDDRMLHGQIVTRWSKRYPCRGILIVDNDTSNNEFQKKIFKNAAPTGTKVGVFDEKVGTEKVNKAQTVENGYFLIAKSPITLVNMMDLGCDFGPVINVGPMSSRPGTVTLGNNVCVTKDEIVAFDELEKRGINIVFQLIPGVPSITWQEMKNKIK